MADIKQTKASESWLIMIFFMHANDWQLLEGIVLVVFIYKIFNFNVKRFLSVIEALASVLRSKTRQFE